MLAGQSAAVPRMIDEQGSCAPRADWDTQRGNHASAQHALR